MKLTFNSRPLGHEDGSLVDALVLRIEQAIVDGTMAPGSRISEQALAREMNVSRGPLREALGRLEGRRLVQRARHLGVRVASLSDPDLHDLLLVREALEGMASRLAATHMTFAQKAELSLILDTHASQDRLKSGTGYYQDANDLDFHVRIVRGSGSDRLVAMLCDELYDLLRIYRYRSSTQPGRAVQALEEHRRILEALVDGDGERAETAMRLHIRNAREMVARRLLEPAVETTVAASPFPAWADGRSVRGRTGFTLKPPEVES